MNRISRFYVKANGCFAKIAVSAVTVLAGLIACGARLPSVRAATTARAPQFLPLNVHVGEKAPDFALLSADGQLVRLSQFAGKNVLLDFYEGYW